MAVNSLMEMLLSRPSAIDKLMPLLSMSQAGSPTSLRGLTSGNTPSELSGGFGPPGTIESQAHDYFRQQGVGPQDWRKVDEIITQESQWDPRAQNPDSPAAGLAQNISGFSPGYSRNDPMEQIKWLYNYLQNHNYEGYGTGIDAAYAHKQDTGWY